MKRKWIKKTICLLLMFALVFSMSVNAYAYSSSDDCSLGLIQTAIVKYVQCHQNMLAKAIVRTQFRTAATAGAALGCRTAATLLNHSLQNRPSDLTYGSNSRYAQQIRNSREFKEIVNQFIETHKSEVNGTYTLGNQTATFNSSLDLYLAYHGMSYTIEGTKSEGKWDISVTFSDTYDFDCGAWERTLSASSIIAAINNYAVYAQKTGAVVPYGITIKVKTTVTA